MEKYLSEDAFPFQIMDKYLWRKVAVVMGLAAEPLLIAAAQIFHNRWLRDLLWQGSSYFLCSLHLHCLGAKRDSHWYKSHCIYFRCFIGYLCPHFYMYGQLQSTWGLPISLLVCVGSRAKKTKEETRKIKETTHHGIQRESKSLLVKTKPYPVTTITNQK